MGWGATRAAPRPVLNTRVLLDPTASQNCRVCGMPQFNSPSGMTCAAGHGGAETAEPEDEPVQPSQAHKDFTTNGQLMARWAPETRFILMMEFINQEDLFGKLNAFLKRKIR